ADLGTTVLMVTHRVREILGFADRYVVLIDGRIESDLPSELATYDKLIDLLSAKKNWTSKPISESPEILLDTAETEIVSQLVKAKYKNTGPLDLNLKCGQIVGITGLVGSGLHEIAYMVAGLLKPTSGSVVIEDHVVSKCIPAHRETEGVFPDETEEFNLTAGNWRRWRRRNGVLDIRKMRSESISVSKSLNLVPLNPEMQVSRLSGGNQQKTLLGRSLINDPDLLVLCEPTRGVDVATRQEIYSQIIAVASRGTAVFMASSDVEDLRSLAHVVGIVDNEGVISQWIDNLGSDSLDILESTIY
ncbi:MAG: ATP-binding cassette domain-containing protein, partial [Gammaproteobacteria bacterium]